jgi:putative hemolysin
MTVTLVLVVAALVVVGVLTAAATAVHSVSRIWLRHWVEQRLAGTAAAELPVESIQRLLLAAGTAVALMAFATGAVLGARWQHEPLVLAERLAIAALLVLVAGQLVPRAIGRRWAGQIVTRLVPMLRWLVLGLAPLVAAAQALATLGRRRGPAPASQDNQALEELLREGELEGVGDAGESAIITGVVEFTGKRARDMMTPRAEIFAIEQSVAVAELAAQVAHSRYSRVPITDGGLDNVVGMLHAFDVLRWQSGPRPETRRVVFARDTAVAGELLSRMLRERHHLAIIQDGNQRTVGLVTLEDLLEELVGDIRDEHDEPAA